MRSDLPCVSLMARAAGAAWIFALVTACSGTPASSPADVATDEAGADVAATALQDSPADAPAAAVADTVADVAADAPAEVTSVACPYVAPQLADKWGAMDYVNYTFALPQGITSVEADVVVLSATTPTTDFYIQIYDANIGASGQYFGIQTSGLVLMSRFGTRDHANARTFGASYLVDNDNEGDFLSLRRDFGSLPSGKYHVRVARAEFDGEGDWFGFFVTFPGQPEAHIGDMRYPREQPIVPAVIHDGGGQWNEFWDNNGSALLPVPLLQLEVQVTANGGTQALHALGSYSPMPNSDFFALAPPGGMIHHELGGQTGRCHPGDANGKISFW